MPARSSRMRIRPRFDAPQILFGVHAHRIELRRLNISAIAAEAILQQPQLLQLLRPLQHARRQGREAVQRRLPVRIQPKMLPCKSAPLCHPDRTESRPARSKAPSHPKPLPPSRRSGYGAVTTSGVHRTFSVETSTCSCANGASSPSICSGRSMRLIALDIDVDLRLDPLRHRMHSRSLPLARSAEVISQAHPCSRQRPPPPPNPSPRPRPSNCAHRRRRLPNPLPASAAPQSPASPSAAAASKPAAPESPQAFANPSFPPFGRRPKPTPRRQNQVSSISGTGKGNGRRTATRDPGLPRRPPHTRRCSSDG